MPIPTPLEDKLKRLKVIARETYNEIAFDCWGPQAEMVDDDDYADVMRDQVLFAIEREGDDELREFYLTLDRAKKIALLISVR